MGVVWAELPTYQGLLLHPNTYNMYINTEGMQGRHSIYMLGKSDDDILYLWFIRRKLENKVLDEAYEELVVELYDVSPAAHLNLWLVEKLFHRCVPCGYCSLVHTSSPSSGGSRTTGVTSSGSGSGSSRGSGCGIL